MRLRTPPPPRDDDPAEGLGSAASVNEELGTSQGAERLIPLRFANLLPSTPPNPCPSQALHDSLLVQVTRANQAFRAAGVQFFIRSMECYAAPNFESPVGTDAHAWPVAYSELGGPGRPLPEMPSNAWFTTSTKSSWAWLGATATQWGRTDELLIWLLQVSPGHNSAVPWKGREMLLNAPAIETGTAQHVLTHELGHLFGLVHPQDIEGVASTSNPDVAMAVDPQTLAHYKKADFWDLVFVPGTTAHTFFTSRAAALPSEASLRQIVNGDTALGTSNCVHVSSPELLTCTVSSAGGNGSGSNVQQFDSNDPELRGLSFFAGAHLSANACSYLPSTDQAPRFFSESEVLMMRKHLRWDSPWDYDLMKYKEGFNEFELEWQSTNRLARLGTGSHRDPLAKLDFNGDGRRDLAVWAPPTAAGTPGRLRVLLSPNFSQAAGQHIDTQFGRLGDIPMVADFDTDGRSDFGVYQPGGGVARSAPADTLAYWRWCSTSSNPAATSCGSVSQTSCPSSSCAQFGARGDLPTPGLELTGASPNERAVYRPQQAIWWWYTTALQARTVGTAAGGTTPGPNAILMPGLYDSDGLSDLVAYYPGMARYYYALSSQSWNTNNQKDMGGQFVPATGGSASDRCGAIPMPMFRQAMQQVCGSFGCTWVPVKRKTFSLYWPHDGTWNTVWDPFGAGTVESCQYGTLASDQPFAGFDRDGDLRADWGIFRDSAAGGSSQLLTRTTVASSCNGGTAVNTSCAACGVRTRVVAVADMTGDGREELLLVQPDTGAIEWRTSESGYVTVGGTWATGEPTALVL
ncbi:MAG: VCBS repeat-containing protein [Polyangiaceae bacterium]|nr:VCBS repeat-containing protein [Polyangiaceae bacterium]